ncbi:WecB/TagA/CpsF family glycosyltransferase [Candidatus Peregrinibacteria bacterium]|nr:WecB/TagA/CpsF family glycosyltransferase [Candidatus Peregrinibacteria bacterium]
MTSKTTVHIAGVPINSISYEDTLRHINDFVRSKRKVYIVTVNPEMILNASRDDSFFEVLEKAELTTPDGIGILWAAHYLSKPLPKNKFARYFQFYLSLLSILFTPKRIRNPLKERVTGVDLFREIVDQSTQKKWKLFLLGASKGVAEKAIENLSKIYPDTHFAGSFAGSPDEEDEEKICELINQAEPDFLFVAYGSPEQECWIYRNLFKLDSVKVAMGVGGTFDFYAGKVKRAPGWMQKVGLEWLWRLFCEPKRFSRIWNATVKFARLVRKEKMENNPAQ